MASPTASSPAVAPTTPPPPPQPQAEAPKILNPNVFRPVTPPSHHSDDGRGPKRAVSFILPTVIVLRLVTIALAIALIVLEFEKTGRYHGMGPFPVVLAFFQLFWLVFAVLRDLGCGGGGTNKGFTVDLGFVKCIFGRSGHEDQEAGEMLLGWVPGDPGRKLNKGLLLTTAADLVFATITFTVGMVVKGGWDWYWARGIYVVAFVIAGLEIIIAFAQHFTILKRARIRISYDEDESEDGLGSHKYRIRLPQSPERGQAPISVYAHTAI